MNDENTNSLEVISGIERAAIDMQISTAHQFPRVWSTVKQKMLSFATLDEETAASCFYTLKRSTKTGEKIIQGPGIRLAEIAASAYGNLRLGSRIVSVVTDGENPHVVVQGVAHDLETNLAVSIEKRRNITAKKDWKTGTRLPVAPDDINLATNACSAIALRDAIYKVVPGVLVKPVMEAAKRVAIGDASSLSSKRAKIIDRLKQMGANEDRILAVVECHKVEDIGMEQLEILIGLGTSIKDGELTIEQAFPAPKEPEAFVPPADSKAQTPKRGPGRPRKASTPKPESDTDAPTMEAGPEVNEEIGGAENTVSGESVQDKLASRLVGEGFSFEDIKKWNRDMQFIKTDLDSIEGFSSLSTADATKLWNSVTGLIRGLKSAKG